MMLAPLLDNPIRARRHCWLFADSVNAGLAMQNCSAIGAQSLQIFSGKMPAARSRLNSPAAHDAKPVAPPPRCNTRAPEPAAKSP